MEPQLVVGLFHSSGIAEDACNRLKTEGVPASEIGLKVLKPTAPLLPTAEAELEGLSVDPLIVGDVRETFAKFIRNGETMVFVRAGTGEQAEFAAETLRQYTPVAIHVLPLSTRTRNGNSVPVTQRARNPALYQAVQCSQFNSSEGAQYAKRQYQNGRPAGGGGRDQSADFIGESRWNCRLQWRRSAFRRRPPPDDR